MSFLLFATVAALAAGTAGFMFGRRRERSETDPAVEGKDAGAKETEDAGSRPVVAAPNGLSRLPLALGDVVSAETDAAAGASRVHVERWLAGGIVARDGDEVVGVVFVAPEGARQESVAVFAPPRRDIALITAVTTEVGNDPPTTIDIEGIVMRRRARIPVRLERIGHHAPRLGDTAIWAEYEASGRAVGIVIRGDAGTGVWLGTRYEDGEYDRMGSGDAA
jgi:hypothetical protein